MSWTEPATKYSFTLQYKCNSLCLRWCKNNIREIIKYSFVCGTTLRSMKAFCLLRCRHQHHGQQPSSLPVSAEKRAEGFTATWGQLRLFDYGRKAQVEEMFKTAEISANCEPKPRKLARWDRVGSDERTSPEGCLMKWLPCISWPESVCFHETEPIYTAGQNVRFWFNADICKWSFWLSVFMRPCILSDAYPIWLTWNNLHPQNSTMRNAEIKDNTNVSCYITRTGTDLNEGNRHMTPQAAVGNFLFAVLNDGDTSCIIFNCLCFHCSVILSKLMSSYICHTI